MGLLKASEKAYTATHLEEAVETVQSLETKLSSVEKKVLRLQDQLTVDATTGLFNSLVLHSELGELLGRTPRTKAVLFIATNDIFGLLKKTFSTKIPEWVMYQTSLRIGKILGEHGKVYQTKENEFLVFLPDVKSKEQIYALARTLIEQLEKNHVMGGYTIGVGFNIGIAFYPEHGKAKSDLLRSADIALSEAVKLKKDFYPFNPQLKERMTEHVELRNGILAALQSQSDPGVTPQLELVFQPQVKIFHWKTAQARWEVIGAEVLIRWIIRVWGLFPQRNLSPSLKKPGLSYP